MIFHCDMEENIETIENILLNVFKHQKSFSLFRDIPHIPMCGGREGLVCVCVCVCVSISEDCTWQIGKVPTNA